MIYPFRIENRKRIPYVAAILIAVLLSGWVLATIPFFSEKPKTIVQQQDSIRPKPVAPDSLYHVLIRGAEALFVKKDYQNALTEYEKARKAKPKDPYPGLQINKINALLKVQAAADANYQKAVGSADKYLLAQDYMNAKAAYQLALDAKPDDPYAKGKLQETMVKLRSMKAGSILYDVALASADKYFAAKEYEKALAQYESASKILPNDKIAKERINEIIRIMVDNQTRDEMYQKSIEAADKFYTANIYQNALMEYKNALKYKPDEIYPQQRITELTALLTLLKTKEESYKKSIALADQLFTDKSYAKSRIEYQNAGKIKPEETYPPERIRMIDNLVASNKKTKEDYDRLITLADSLYIGKKYINAKANYQLALNLKPNEAYPKEMISKSDNLQTGQQANEKNTEEAYQSAIVSADKSFLEKNYEVAKSGYQTASGIKPSEQYPKTKIAETEKILAAIAQQKLDEETATAQKLKADAEALAAKKLADETALAQKKLADEAALAQKKLAEEALLAQQKLATETALAERRKAVEDSIAQVKLAEDAALALKRQTAEAALAAKKALEDQYKTAITSGDGFLSDKKYIEAKDQFLAASKLKPTEKYPKGKIAEIDLALANLTKQQETDAAYSSAILSADKNLADKSLEQAKKDYQSALVIKPGEKYPREQIAVADKMMADAAKMKALDDNYNSTVANADKFFDAKSYDEAKTEYGKALALKPAEEYPKSKIAAIDKIFADLAAQRSNDQNYTAGIQKADKLLASKSFEDAKAEYNKASLIKPEETYPKTQVMAIDKVLNDFSASIAKADQLVQQKSYTEAKTEYTNALTIRAGQKYPQDKIAEIDKILADLAVEKELNDKYEGIIAGADKLFTAKTYDQAKSEYTKASALKPAEEYPRTKIAAIEKALADLAAQRSVDENYTAGIQKADKLLATKSYEDAKAEYNKASLIKPEETYPKTQVMAIDKVLNDFSASITKADQLVQQKSYTEAKAEYTNALTIRAGQKYPQDKIAEIDKILADLAVGKALSDKYDGIVAGADKLFTAKTYDLAKSEYTKASALKPVSQYPKDQIAAIDAIKADQAKAKQTDDDYKASIVKADLLFTSKSWEPAKAAYLVASGLKPAEEYPKTRIAAIEKIFADQKTLEDQYNAGIASADQSFAANTFDVAKAEYLKASTLKPSEKYPRDQVALIDRKLSEASQQKLTNDKFNASVAKADKLFGDKNYSQARIEYTNSLIIKPKEIYPADRITEIDVLLAKFKADDDAYKASIAKANGLLFRKSYEEARAEYQNAGQIKPEETFPKEKITEINKLLTEMKGKKETFDDLVAEGDKRFKQNDYYKAKDNYMQALDVFPDESYTKQRLNRVNAVIDSIYRTNKSFYDKAIAEGDKAFNSYIFDKAIDSYYEAIGFLPNEKYPVEMIAKIKKSIAENAMVDVLTTSTIIKGGAEMQFPFKPVDISSRKNNYFYIKIKNLSDKSFNVLVRYGKDKAISGGAVIRNLAFDGKVNDRLVSVRNQDPWFRIDNNYISLYPQGGDVEVTFIQISRAAE